MKILYGVLLAFLVWFSRPDPLLESRLEQVKHWIDGDSLEAAHAAMQEMDLTGASDYQRARYYFRKAYLQVHLHSHYLQGLKDYKRAYYYLQNADTTDLQMAFDLLNNQGRIYSSHYDYEGALAVYDEAMKVCDRRKPSDVLESDQASTFTTQNFTFSEASKVFYNKEEAFIELVAGDYVANPDFIEVQLQRFNLSQDVEIQGVTDVKLDLDPAGVKSQFFAWGSYNPVKKLALVNIGINYRYIISISMTGADSLPGKGTIQSWVTPNSLP